MRTKEPPLGWRVVKSDVSDGGTVFAPEVNKPNKPQAKTTTTAKERDDLYRVLLKNLGLIDEHRAALRERGLSDEQIDAGQYASLGRNRSSAVQRLLNSGKDNALQIMLATPGFYKKDDGTVCLAGRDGILIPVRDHLRRIIALKIRADEAGDGGRYSYLSSKSKDGPSPGSPVHFPLKTLDRCDVVRITEGELKADVAFALSGTPTMSLPGVSSWAKALPEIERMGASRVLVAFDADAREKPLVADALRQLVAALRNAGRTVEIETWDAANKGIDDALKADAKIDTLTGDAVDEYLAGLPSRASATPPAKDTPTDRIPLGDDDPLSGRVVLSPAQTLPTAERCVRQWYMHEGHRTLHANGGTFYQWRQGRYVPLDDGELRHRLQPFLHRALQYSGRGKDAELVDFGCNDRSIKDVVNAIRDLCYLPTDTAVPSWLADDPGNLPINELLPCRSSLIHIPTRKTLPATPVLFNVNSCEFEPDLDSGEEPAQWIRFLNGILDCNGANKNESGKQQIELLQEWFGYCLTADTSQQKMLLVVGPKRSGKGTIGRVLTSLVGAGNVCGPTTSSLAGPFGLQPLIEKSLAIVSDARFRGDGIGTVVERLLCISGEDRITIDRKHLASVSLRLPTRFVFMTNEAPDLTDASGALVARFLVLTLTKSFYGHEDPGLLKKLEAELPQILNWSLRGWYRLHARGHFHQPEAGRELIEDMSDMSSPVSAFVREACEIDSEGKVHVSDLYAAWEAWCKRAGWKKATTIQQFGKDLKAAFPGVVRKKDTHDRPFYKGLWLKPEFIVSPEPESEPSVSF